MGLLAAGTLAGAAAGVLRAVQTADEMRSAIVKAIAIGGPTWTVERPADTTGGPATPVELDDPITLDVVRSSKLGLGNSLSAALIPGANYLGFGPSGQDLIEGDYLSSEAEPDLRFRVLVLDDREIAEGRIMAILAWARR